MRHPPFHAAQQAKLDERRRLMRRTWALAALGVASGGGAVLLACGGGGGGGGTGSAGGAAAPSGAGPAPAPGPEPAPGSAPAPGPAPAPGTPGTPSDPGPSPAPPAPPLAAPALGAHGLSFHRFGESQPSLSVAGLSTRASASTVLACVGRGLLSADVPPTDSAGNVYTRLGASHVYTLWPTSGTTLYACVQARGIDGLGVAVAKPDPGDEVTLSVVEIANGGLVRDVQWKEVLAGQPLTSASVSTTGPALLVAWWWGDSGVYEEKTAVPDNGFTVIDTVLASGALVQCAVAVRQVEAAGSYNVTWTSTPLQGAQLWLAAVQAAAS